MKILVSGSSGLIGSALVPHLKEQGHDVVRLVRREPSWGGNEVRWDPASGVIDAEGLAGIEGAVHLSGENIGAKRWTDARKAAIRDSRVNSTRLLSDTLVGLEPRPRVVACASALGYYGDRGSDILREDNPPGDDFLGMFGQEWEQAAQSASQTGIRVVNMRFGLVLSTQSDLLKRMLPAFRLGLGGKLGNGRQYMSWITLHDLVRAITHILNTPELEGPVNVCSPYPVTNAEFTKTLGEVLSRPAIFTVPAFALRLAFGEMADSILASVRMDSTKLVNSGFGFEHPVIGMALREVIGKS